MIFKPVDYVVIILVSILFIFFVGLTLEIIISDEKMESESRKIIENILMSLIAIISIYVGAKIGRKNDV